MYLITNSILDISKNFIKLLKNKDNKNKDNFGNRCDSSVKNVSDISDISDVSRNMLYIIIISNILFSFAYIWFCSVYINDIDPKIKIAYQSFFLLLVYFLLIGNSITLINSIFSFFIL